MKMTRLQERRKMRRLYRWCPWPWTRKTTAHYKPATEAERVASAEAAAKAEAKRAAGKGGKEKEETASA